MTETIAVVGTGRLAHSMVPALQAAGVEVLQVLSRTQQQGEAFASAFDIHEVVVLGSSIDPRVSCVLLCVPDQAIPPVASQLIGTVTADRIFAHTSGSTDVALLSPLGEHIGVLYPLQMFTQQKQVDLQQVPLFVEGNGQVQDRLIRLAQRLSERVYPLDSAARLRLHLGAVIACNFSNYLFQWAASQIEAKEGMDFTVYEPLLREQVDRVFELGPQHTQTGPAIRGDLSTIQQHVDLLEGHPQLAQLYQTLSTFINPALGIDKDAIGASGQ